MSPGRSTTQTGTGHARWLRALVPTGRRGRIILALGLVVIVAAAVLVVNLGRSRSVATRSAKIAATPEAGQPVQLDTTLYLPEASAPAPAILLAHGLGGTKNDLDAEARDLARDGFVVLAYTARGFGDSGGLVHLDAPDYEIADAKLLVTYLASLPQVRTTAPGDPVVGVAGSSYGGGLALLLAGSDPRIDAVAADITWNSLQNTLFPNGATGQQGGVFKKLWTGYLFQTAHGNSALAAANPACGRTSAGVCAAFQDAGVAGQPSAATSALLAASSPASTNANVHAPTLLTQGEQDSLFPLTEADANAKQIAANGTAVKVVWRSGGHDASGGANTVTSQWRSWFENTLKKSEKSPNTAFEMANRGSAISTSSGQTKTTTLRDSAGYPGVTGRAQARSQVSLTGAEQTISAPSGGNPAAVSTVPGLGGLLEQASALGAAGSALTAFSSLPGQSASFDSTPLPSRLRIAGASSMTLRVTPSTSADATLFVSLLDLSPDGTSRLPASLTQPLQLTGLTPGQSIDVQVQLPAIVTDIAAGHRVRVQVATTNLAYQMPTDAREYRIALASTAVTVPGTTALALPSGSPWPWLITGVVVSLLGLAWVLIGVRRQRRFDAPVAELTGTPVSIRSLVKEYDDGYRAVDGPSFSVERGQVVGLLGPNGAGKTTLLRVLVGLIMPTSGEVYVFGQRVRPGAAVLSRLGVFIEGPGFLPHLSGRENLQLFWAASGRPIEAAQFDIALEIAGLGASVERRVKSYSQGMRQRLAIAQAMLGLPELLVLDEPTNGLDPPQIAEMREVLRSYAATGRTVVISSHLLAEVEQTCTHVVVMHRGRLVAAGAVDEIAGGGASQLALDEGVDALEALRVLTEAGIAARTVTAQRSLEEVFLDLVEMREEAPPPAHDMPTQTSEVTSS